MGARMTDELGCATFYNTGQLFRLPRTARDATASDPSQALVAIVFAAAGAEATLSDVITLLLNSESARHPLPDKAKVAAAILRFPEVAETRGVMRRMNNIRVALGHEPVDLGGEPGQSWGRLFALRNHVLHLRPEEAMALEDREDRIGGLVKEFIRLGLVPAPPSGRIAAAFTHLNSPGVAGWCVDTSVAFAKSVVDCLPDGHLRESAMMMTGLVWSEGDSATDAPDV